MKRLLLLLLLAASVASSARAQPLEIWETGEPASAFDKAMGQADKLGALAAAAYREHKRGTARRLARQAIDAYQRAIKLDRSRAEPHLRAAELLYAHTIEDTNPTRTDMRQTVAHWHEFERLAPLDPRMESILFRRSLTYTKLGGDENYRKSVEDYDRELELIDQSSVRHRKEHLSRILSNRAEILMALGELDAAIMGYEQAMDYRDEPLYGYGLAVALDRDGQAQRARQTMRIYARSDPGDALTEQGVFFVPEGDIHYYQALRAEALGDFKAAILLYSQFVAALPQSPWAKRARQNLRELQHKKGRP